MARKNLWTPEELKKMADEIDAKKVENPSYTAKDYAEDKQVVYGTLYQALRRAGLFKPSRQRVKKSEQKKTEEASVTA